MKTTTSLFLLALGTATVAAQTASKPPVKHTPPATAAHTVAVAPKPAGGECVTVFTVSPKLPALPASAPCPKALYILTQHTPISADYLSPLLGPKVREELDFKNTTVTLAYVDTQAGTGPLVEQGKRLKVKYTGWTPDGNKFDSSEDRPGKEPLSVDYGMHSVIQGWDTGLEGMHVGGKRRLFIPFQLGYGDKGAGMIPPRSNLVFDVEVVSQGEIPPPEPPPSAAKPATPPPAAGKPAETPKPAEPKQ